MRSQFVTLVSGVLFASTMAGVGCGDDTDTTGVMLGNDPGGGGGGGSSGVGLGGGGASGAPPGGGGSGGIGTGGGGASGGGISGGGAGGTGVGGGGSGGTGGGSGGVGVGGGGSGGMGGGAGGMSGGAGGMGAAGGGDGGAGGEPATGPASECVASMVGGTAVTSLCGTAPLNTLTTMERSQLRLDSIGYFVSTITLASGCAFSAFVGTASASVPTDPQAQATCTSLETSCNATGTNTVGEGTIFSNIPATCTMTVEQYSTCIIDEVPLFEQGAGALDCSTITVGSVNAGADVSAMATQAPSCMAIMSACLGWAPPQIF